MGTKILKRMCLLGKHGVTVLALSLIIWGCTGTSPADSDKGGGDTDESPTVNEEVLSKLGLDQDSSEQQNNKGEAVTEDMNPFGKRIFTYATEYEIFQAGADISSYGRHFMGEQDDYGNEMNILSQYNIPETGVGADWLDLPKKSISGDMDGDGYDEIITAVFDGEESRIYFKYAGPDGTYNIKALDNQTFMEGFGLRATRAWAHDDYFMRDFTAGDFDKDGLCDFALSCMTGVIILDNDLNVVGSFEVDDPDDMGRFVRVEAGDLNGDDFDDLVVVDGGLVEDGPGKGEYCDPGSYYIFQGGEEGLGINPNSDPLAYAELHDVLRGKSVYYCSGEMALADYDGDGLKELVLAGVEESRGWDDDYFQSTGTLMDLVRQHANLGLYASIIDPYNESTKTFIATHPVDDYDLKGINSNGGAHPRNFYVPRVVPGKFNGGTKDYFNVLDLILSINDSGEFEVFQDGMYTATDTTAYHNMAYDLAVAGDVTGNGCDDLVYMTFSTLPWDNGKDQHHADAIEITKFVVWGKNSSGNFTKIREIPIYEWNVRPNITLANVDDDSLVVEYETHELVYSDPKILAVLASPPYIDGVDMDLNNSSTTYKLSQVNETSHSGTLGFYVTTSFGFMAEEGEFGASFGASIGVDITSEWAWSWGQTRMLGHDISHIAHAEGDDQVIFAGVPMDVYSYKILTAPKKEGFLEEDGSYLSAGDYLTVNVPREPLIHSVSVGYYNSVVEEDQRIPRDILHHNIGDAFSYYTSSELADLVAEEKDDDETWLATPDMNLVCQGHATLEVSKLKTITTTSTYNCDLTMGAEQENKYGYVYVNFGGGIHVGYAYEHNTSDGLEILGAVGSIIGYEDYENNLF